MQANRFVIVRHARCGYVKRCDCATVEGAARYRDLCGSRVNCPKCGERVALESNWIEGTLSKHKCDVRCTSAKGPKCECSCGGANHGVDWQ